MARTSGEYTRLPGKGRRSGLSGLVSGTTTLWLGKDHLLAVESHGYTESYRRYDYGDIQSIVLTRTSRAAGLVALVAVIMAIELIGSLAAGQQGFLWALLGSAPIALALLVHAGRGPTCDGFIQTAVNREALVGISRVGPAQKAIAQLTGRISTAQGELDREALIRGADAPTRATPAAVAAASSGVTTSDGYRGGYHLALFSFMLMVAALTLNRLIWLGAVWPGLDYVLALPLLGSAIAAAIRQRSVPVLMRRLVWASFGYFLMTMYFSGMYGTFLAVSQAEPGEPIPAVVSMPLEGPLWSAFQAVSCAIAAGIGISGSLQTIAFRRSAAAKEAADIESGSA